MRQYERYLFSHLLWPTVIITVSLTGIVWLTQVLKFLDFILNRGLSLGDFLTLTGLMLPSLLLILLPITLTIAVIYTYNKLTVESELVVLGAVGVSKWQLAKPALWLSALAGLLCYALALYVAPVANERFRDIRTLFRDKYASVLLEEEVFNNPVDGVTVFVRERDGNNRLGGIILHDNRNVAEPVTMIAERGRVEQTPSGPRFYLENGIRQQRRNGIVDWLKFDNYAIDIAFYGATGARKKSTEELTIGALFAREGLSEKEIAAYRAEATQRLTWPIFALALPLFALAVMFTSEFSRRGQARRMIVIAVSMALLVIVYFALRNLTVKQPMLMPLMYVLTLGTAALAAKTLWQGRAPRHLPMLLAS